MKLKLSHGEHVREKNTVDTSSLKSQTKAHLVSYRKLKQRHNFVYDGFDAKGLFFLYDEGRPNCIDNFVADCSKQHLVHLVVKSVDRRMKNAAGTKQRRQVRHRVWLNSKEGYYMFVE